MEPLRAQFIVQILVNDPRKTRSSPVTQVKFVDGEAGETEMRLSTVTVREAVIDSAWCGQSRPLQSRTEIASMLPVLNERKRVKGSAVTGAGRR